MHDRRAPEGAHLGERAELYALGALEPVERTEVETHVARCADCLRALGAAEATVTTLAEAWAPRSALPAGLGARLTASAHAGTAPAAPVAARSLRMPGRDRRRRLVRPGRSVLAAAATLLVAAGIGTGSLLDRAADGRRADRESSVLATLANAHFLHVSLRARGPAAPVAKVLYARDGAWLYVIVASATCVCRVRASSPAGNRDLGRLEVRGTTATLFVRDPGRPESLALIGSAGQVVADTAIRYPAK